MDDRISNLTSPMIENILCLVPIQEAARTSILSKEWRYHWTKIPKLVINEGTFQVSPGKGDQHSKRQKLYDAIYQILLQHKGPIHEFTLSTYAGDACYEIDRIISHLPLTNTIKKFTLKLGGYTFPISLSPLNQLTDLYLSRCFLNYQSAFNGFGSLTNLYMKDVYTSKRMLLYLLSNSPLIKSLTLNIGNGHLQGIETCTVTNLFDCLRVIENLTISLWVIKKFAQDGSPRVLPTALIHLKYLCVKHASFYDKYGNFPSLALIMRNSPNLEKLHIRMINYISLENPERDSVAIEDLSDISLEHLTEL
ncbi:F-box/FBD/LRR-repeat protein [Tanacetum coccineum]